MVAPALLLVIAKSESDLDPEWVCTEFHTHTHSRWRSWLGSLPRVGHILGGLRTRNASRLGVELLALLAKHLGTHLRPGDRAWQVDSFRAGFIWSNN